MRHAAAVTSPVLPATTACRSCATRNGPGSAWQSRSTDASSLRGETNRQTNKTFIEARVNTAPLVKYIREKFSLPQLNVRPRIVLDALDGSRIGAALVDGDPRRHVVQSDGSLQESPRSSAV